MKNKRVLISGSGIAGLSLAYWLKKYGFEPTVVEKHTCLREGGYKVDVRGTALQVAKRMGIYESLLEANVNLVRSQIVTSDERVYQFDGDMLGHCCEGDVEVNRWDLVQIISKRLEGVEIIYDDYITKIDDKVYFQNSPPREFDMIIGADGIHSNIRRLAFGEDAEFLKEFGIHFCVFEVDDIFDFERGETVYFEKGKFAAVYTVNQKSLACLAFKPNEGEVVDPSSKLEFERQFSGMGWKIPYLIDEMKHNENCYLNSIAQVRMPTWSKENVALVGDSAHAASAMGTSLALTGAYVLARELRDAAGDYSVAFTSYENSMRRYVEDAQKLAESNHQLLINEDASPLMSFQLYLMEAMPKRFVQLFTLWGKWRMKRVANAMELD